MLSLLFLSCLPFLVCGKTERDIDATIQAIMREHASMIKHCMTNVCSRSMCTHDKPVNQSSEEMVAFSAFPPKDLINVAKHTKIVFGGTRNNIGKAYNPTTGIFTAPVDGLYAFHISITIQAGKYTVVYFNVNGSYKTFVYGNARGYRNWYSASQSFVTNLQKGGTVNLATGDTVAEYIHQYSTFTGYRL